MRAERYEHWIRLEAQRIRSDACTWVLDLAKPCCYEHDVAYHYGRDPRSAYLVGWPLAAPISRREADRRFRRCMQRWSIFGSFSPLSWLRWAGVRLGGWMLWTH